MNTIFNVHAILLLKKIIYGRYTNTKPFGALVGFKHFTTYLYRFIIAPIPSLVGTAGPSAIFLAIIPIVIYSFQRKAFWPRPHIKNKIIKTKPSFANPYTPTAISKIIFMSWVITSHPHFFPNRMFRPMYRFYSSGSSKLFLCTAATGCYPKSDRGPANYLFFSTIADTFPVGSIALRLRPFNDSKFVEFFPRNIYRIFHHRNVHEKYKLATGSRGLFYGD